MAVELGDPDQRGSLEKQLRDELEGKHGQLDAAHRAALESLDASLKATGAEEDGAQEDGCSDMAATASSAAEVPFPSLEEQHAFLDACKGANFAAVRAMVEQNPALVNVTPSGRWSALQQIAAKGDQETLQLLLAHGADHLAKNKDGNTALDVAHERCRNILADMRAAGAEEDGGPDIAAAVSSAAVVPPPSLEEQHAFLDACKGANFAAVRAMVEQNPALVNVTPGGRWSALQQIAAKGDEETLRHLLAHSADHLAKNKDGNTALDVAHGRCRKILADKKDAATRGAREYLLCLHDVIGPRPNLSFSREEMVEHEIRQRGEAWVEVWMQTLRVVEGLAHVMERVGLSSTQARLLTFETDQEGGGRSFYEERERAFRERDTNSGLKACFYELYAAYVLMAKNQSEDEGATTFYRCAKVSELSQEYLTVGSRVVQMSANSWCLHPSHAEHYFRLAHPAASEDDMVLLILQGRPNDDTLHMPVSVSNFVMCPDERCAVTPPLTALLITGTERQGESRSQQLSGSCSKICVYLTCTFSPQLLGELILPTETDAVWDAVHDGNPQALDQRLQQSPTMNLEYGNPKYNHSSLLYSACRHGQFECAKTLIEHCAHVNSQSHDMRSTALHAAAYCGHPQIVEMLLENLADLSLKNNHGLTPVEEAAPSTKSLMDNAVLPTSLPAKGLKLAGDARQLRYGSRAGFILGLRAIVGEPIQTMQQEFMGRPACKWENLSGKCTARKTWQRAVAHVLKKSLMRNKKRIRANMSYEELLGCVLYTGDAYTPLNNWLRELGLAVEQGDHGKVARLRSPELSWTSTVLHIVSGMQKLVESEGKLERRRDPSAAYKGHDNFLTFDELEARYRSKFTLDEIEAYWRDECTVGLIRGIEGVLKPDFFVPDERGMVTLTEYSFVSTSRNPSVASNFGGSGVSVFIKLTPKAEDAFGFHNGADLDWLSMYPGEEESLFPPGTLFDVVRRKREGMCVTIEVLPIFLFK